MLSRGYLQSHLLVFIVTFSFLLLSCVLSVCTAENDVISPSTSQNETDSSEKFFQGFETGTTISNGADSSTESTAIPALSASLFPSSTTAADAEVEATTDLPASSSYSSAEKSTVTILPSAISAPSMIVTATKVTLGHRMLESSTESKEGSTEAPPSLLNDINTADDGEVSTDAPSYNTLVAGVTSPARVLSSSLTDDNNNNNNHIISNNDNGGVHQETVPFVRQGSRKSRYHRYHDDNYAHIADEQEPQTDHPSYRHNNNGEASTEYYKEMEMEGGDSYGDFGEDNDLTEQLPTPMALINPNGEGNNPPLEDDFAEAFKKVNSNGKRRRFRGGRRGRMKLKKMNDTNSDNNASSSIVAEQEETGTENKAGVGSEWAAQSTTASPSSASPKFKRYRSTTPSPLFGRSSSSSATTGGSVSTETPNIDEGGGGGGGPVVKNGPKPMILQSVNYDDTSSNSNNNNNGATPVPQIEKPGNGGHTEKISTYFFSTPSPSARLRLRQKIRESLPTTLSTSTTTTTTTTTTESSPADNSVVNNFAADSDVWKNEFSDFPQNQYFTEVSQPKFKIPDFVPLNLGVEPDKQEEEPVENSLSRPDPAEKKAYSLDHYHHSSESPLTSSHGNYDSGYSSSSSSSTTPKSHKVRRPTLDPHSKHEKKTRISPTKESEQERPVRTEYHAQGSNTEASTTFSSSSHRPTPGGSHYDRTKDRVIFYNDSPYSTQHSSTAGVSELTPSITEIPPGSSSQTLGSHLTVSEGPSYYESPLTPMVSIDHHHYPTDNDGNNHIGNIFTRGQVYPADDAPPIESTFQNGPPDSSYIHSPNIVEHAQPLPPLTVEPSDSDDLQHFNSHPPHHNNHDQGAFSQNFVEESQQLHHQPMGTPGGRDPSGYGTVEEVAAHSNPSHENHSPHHHHHPHHNMHSFPPPPGYGPFNPFGPEHPPQSPPHHAPAMPYHPPHNYYPLPPPLSSHHGGEQSLATHPIPPPPLPPPPPPPLSNLHSHHHSPHHHHNSFAPSYEIHPTDSDNNHDNHNNNQHDSQLISNHIADSPSEMSHPHGPPSMHTPPHEHTDVHSSGSLPSPTAASPPDFPPSLLSNAAPDIADGDPHSAYSNGAPHPPPPPPPSSHVDQSFHPHAHTMATHPDYEPANPPLPHDHPFHNSFIPFPSQDLIQPHEHHGHDTNSISGAPHQGSAPYHPGVVENVPTGKPASFEPSPLIPSKFTPIPDDVKDTDLYNSFGPKPHDSSASQHSHPGADTPEISLSSNHIPDPHQQHAQHYNHPNDQVTTYLGPSGADDHHSSYHPHHHPSGGGPTSGGPHSNTDVNGYSGPVNEIHSGIYHPPPSNNDPVLSDHSGGGDSYRDHHNHNNNYDSHDNSPNGVGGYNTKYNHNGESAGPGGYKSSNDFGSYDKPLNDESHHHDSDTQHQPQDTKSSNSLHESDDGKKEKKQKASFSNTPYVLMFPQLIPEEKMRPSPPSMLSKEIPVIQASSMTDYTTGPGSGEKPPLGPGFQAVPVHPRHQMYQVLAKTHYEKMMERYRESKKKPPSAIYTPYGILVPVGTNVDAAASMNHNVFSKHRLPPKFRGEKSLLNALLGSPSTSHNRFHPGPVMSNRQTKIFEYEPAIDVLAEKLAMKIVNAQRALNHKKAGRLDISEKSDGKSDDPLDKSSTSSRNPSFNKDTEDHMTMESKTHATFANPELKDYLKNVLKGHLTEMVETTVSVEDNRRPATLSSKLLNSFFRKGRITMNQPHPPPPSPQMLMQPSASMIMANKVPPPPGMQTQPSPHHHNGIGHPFPPPILPQGPGGLLGTIRRLFSFAPPEARYDIGVAPNFAGRTLYTNGTHLPYIDGPSPRSSHFPPQIILPHPNMAHQHFPPSQHLHSRIPGAPAPPSLLTAATSNNSGKSTGGEGSNGGSASPTPKPYKKKRKQASGSSSSSPKKSTDPEEQGKWQSSSRLISSSASSSSMALPSAAKLTAGSPQGKGTTTTTAKPNTNLNIKSNVGYYHRGVATNSSSSNGISNNGNSANPNSRHVIMNKKPSIFGGSSSNSATSYTNDKSSSKISKGGDSHYDASSMKKTSEIILNKRLGIAPSSSSSSASVSSADTKEQPSSNQPAKLDMFQTILGSTRSVLNYFKSTEARKSSGSAPTVLEPRSATTATRKRRSMTIISRT